MKILYFGTPYFSAEILTNLISNNIEIVAVVTQIDKIYGKRKYISDVKKTAQALLPNVKIFQPAKASDPNFIDSLKKINADLFVVVAYGQILKQELLNIPKYGCINIHASLLPKYRGANPIRFAILKGEKKSGVSIMKMVKKMDAGDVLLQDTVDILEEDDFSSLENKLIEISKPLLLKAIDLIEKKQDNYNSQDDTKVSFAPKIQFEDRIINWDFSALDIFNQIKAFSPKPGAFAFIKLGDEIKKLKILKTKIENQKLKPKEISIQKDSLIVGCQDKALSLISVQLEGKNKIFINDFLRGIKSEILFQ